jgi:ribosomal protein S18 acetylase RimI-like enzyme
VISVETPTEVTDELLAAVTRLVPQLSRSSPAPTRSQLTEIVNDPDTTLFMARAEDGALIGTLTLARFRIPTGVRAWIEDVVVDERARGEGVGEALTRAALEAARNAGARTVELTSRPSRESANRLYQRMGFSARETNVYRFDLSARSANDPPDGSRSDQE